MASVEIQSIGKNYGSVAALSDINLSVAEGEFLTLLGPSGSGKTTLLNMIAGLGTPDVGKILIGGQDVTQVLSSDRNIGIVFQSYALFPHMSVFDNVAFPLRVRGKSAAVIREEVSKTIQRVKLSGFENRKPAELSGGQQQRVALARAIVFQPTILLLDEPLGALDKNLREELQFELRELQKNIGITAIMVTHDQEEAMSLSDRIAVFKSGRIEQVGEPNLIYKSPVNRFIADFFGANNFFTGTTTQKHGKTVLRSDDGVEMDIPEGAVPGSGPVEVMLRPESIKLSAASVDGPLSGKIEGCVNLGSTVRYRVRLPSERLLAIQRSGAERIYSKGDLVTVSWTPDELRLLNV